MAERAFVHAADRLFHRLLGTDGLGVRGHGLAQLGRRGLQAGGDDADEQVALGEDAEQAPVLDDEDAAATLLGHALGRVADRLVGAGADEVGTEATAMEDGAYGTLGHGALPDTAVGPSVVRGRPSGCKSRAAVPGDDRVPGWSPSGIPQTCIEIHYTP